MQQQFKDDLKAAWQATVPTINRIGIFIGVASATITWILMVVWQLCTNFWVGMLMLGVTIVVVNMVLNYLRIVNDRKSEAEYEARQAERNRRRGY